MRVNQLPDGIIITDLLLTCMNMHEAVGSSYVS